MNNPKNYKVSAVMEWLIILLFFCGVALIAAGLWQIWQPLALVFLGIACLYLACCVNLAAKSPERTEKK